VWYLDLHRIVILSKNRSFISISRLDKYNWSRNISPIRLSVHTLDRYILCSSSLTRSFTRSSWHLLSSTINLRSQKRIVLKDSVSLMIRWYVCIFASPTVVRFLCRHICSILAMLIFFRHHSLIHRLSSFVSTISSIVQKRIIQSLRNESTLWWYWSNE